MSRFGDRVKRNSRKNWIAIVGALLAMCLFLLGYDFAGYVVFLVFGVVHMVRHFRRGEPWWA